MDAHLNFTEWSLLHSFLSFEDETIISEMDTSQAEIIHKLVAMGLCNCVHNSEDMVAWITKQGHAALAASPYSTANTQ